VGRGLIQYSLPKSGRQEAIAFSAYLNYRLADGSLIHVDQQAAWCGECGRFVVAEFLADIDELKKTLAELRDGDEKQLDHLNFVGRSVEEETDQLSRRIEWRRGRTSPPRCLQCGSPTIVPLPAGEEFPHPATGEKVIVGSMIFADMEWWEAEFSPEGEKLPAK
jgi:hypothetical protein